MVWSDGVHPKYHFVVVLILQFKKLKEVLLANTEVVRYLKTTYNMIVFITSADLYLYGNESH